MKYILLFFVTLFSLQANATNMFVATHMGLGSEPSVSKAQMGVTMGFDDIYNGFGAYYSTGEASWDYTEPINFYRDDSDFESVGVTYELSDKVTTFLGYSEQMNRVVTKIKDKRPQPRYHVDDTWHRGADFGFRYKFEGLGTAGLGYQTATKVTYLIAGIYF